MTKDDCFELGYITKTHGLDGEVLFFLDVNDPTAYNELDTVFIEERGQLVPYFIESMVTHKDRFIVKLEDIDALEAAETLRGAQLFLPLAVLPELEDGQFYYHEVIGYTVVDQQQGKLGTVKNVYTNAAQDIINMSYKGKEVLIPVTDDIVIRANHDTKELEVNLPEGLVDVYMED
ncbi:ribosome maturation factor RimM [Limibacter armeniacum]|uniref:ribosome maturation factor RimM n=1 Tax=Limibacter armeniacum TaxID=466084 RepID=UPI002FE63884